MWRNVLNATLVAILASGCNAGESRHAIPAKPEPGRAAAADSPKGRVQEVRVDANDAGTSSAVALPEPAPKPEARVERLLVPGDVPASIVRAADGVPPTTVFVPGVCSNGAAYLHTFPNAAQNQGGVVAIEGDQPCGADGYRTFSWDAARLHARVEAALAAAGVTEIGKEGVTLVGYSQGAALAEQMVQRWPERYGRLVLIGAPTDPSSRNLARARAVVTMSCDRDVPARMKQAATATARAGTPATYVEMRSCTHGNVTDGESVFATTFDWLRAHERAPDPRVASVRIVGLAP
jgi:pimeloyl-ACP methyl ester carboxylesterase